MAHKKDTMPTETIENPTQTTTVETPTVKIETPTTVVAAVKATFSAEKNLKGKLKAQAKAAFDFGKTTTLPAVSIRQALAQAIAAAMGLPVEAVLNSKKKGGNETAYTRLSELFLIAHPRSKNDKGESKLDPDKQFAIEQALEDETKDWLDVKEAARGKAATPRATVTGETTGGEKGGTEKPLTLEQHTTRVHAEIIGLMQHLKSAGFGAQDGYNTAIAAATMAVREQMRLHYPGVAFNAKVEIPEA